MSNPSSLPRTVFFICETFSGYQSFFNGQVDEPQGLPPLYNTWNGYVSRGHEIHIFTQDYEYDTYRDWEYQGWHLHNVPAPFKMLRKKRHTRWGKVLFRIGRLIGLLRVWSKARKVAATSGLDVVYAYSPWSTLVSLTLSWQYRAVHVLRRFGTFLYEFIQGQKSFWKSDSAMVEVMAFRLPYDLVVMTNDGTFGDRVCEHFRCPPEKVRFWTNGINKNMKDSNFDRAAFRRSLGLPEDCPILLSLGRLADWKRVDRVIHTMAEVHQRHPDVRLVVVGSGALEEQLKQLAEQVGIAEVTHFVGGVAHSRVKDFFNGSDIYLQFFDTTNRCNPLFEAMVCAMPVITLFDPSTEDLVIHEKTALCVERDDPHAAADYVSELLSDVSRSRSLGSNAREYVLREFSTWPERIDREIDTVLSLCR